MRSPRTTALLSAGLLILGMAACSTPDEEIPDLPATSAATPTPTESEPAEADSATLPPGLEDRSDPELGIRFVGLEDLEIDEDTASAVDLFLMHRVESRRSEVDRELSPFFSTVVLDQSLIDVTANKVEAFVKDDVTFDGEVVVEILEVQREQDEVMVRTCTDYSDITVTDRAGTAPFSEDHGDPRILNLTQLIPGGETKWFIADKWFVEEPC